MVLSVKHRFRVTFQISYGRGYPSLLVTNISNPFWKDLLLSWASFWEIFKIENVKQVMDSPIWYNSKSSRGRSFYIKIGLRKVLD